MPTPSVACRQEYLGHQEAIYTLAPTPEPYNFFSAGSDGVVAEWSARTGANLRGLLQAPVPVYSLHQPPNTKWLVVGLRDGGLHLVDLQTHQVQLSTQVHSDAIFGLTSSPGLGLLFSSGRDGQIAAWRLHQEQPQYLHSIHPSRESIRGLDVCPDGGLLAAASSDNYLRVFSASNLQEVAAWPAHSNSVFVVRFAPGGRYLLSAGRDAHLKVWDVQQSFKLVEDLVAHTFAINDLVFSPNGRHFATASMDKTLKLWESDTLRLRKVVDFARHSGHASSVNRLLWLPDNELLSCSDDRRILQWRFSIPEGQPAL